MGTSLYGVGVLGVVLLLFTGSISVVGFFRRHAPGESEWGTLVVPALVAVRMSAHRVRAPHPGEAPHIGDETTGPHVTTAEAPALAG
jgi:hypothetical protein